MRILGIDPGYGITGFGLIEAERGNARLLQCGAITTPAGMDFSARLALKNKEDKDKQPQICKIKPIYGKQKSIVNRHKSAGFQQLMLFVRDHTIKQFPRGR